MRGNEQLWLFIWSFIANAAMKFIASRCGQPDVLSWHSHIEQTYNHDRHAATAVLSAAREASS